MFSIGYDPEMFFKLKGQVKIISGIGKIGGNKHEPRIVSPEGHGVLEDNVAAEFNGPPADNKQDFKKNINFMVNYLEKVAELHGCELARGVASASLMTDQLQHPDALVFGCEPDFNAWEQGMVNNTPACEDPNFRCCGGHIHVGSEQDPLYLIKKMDFFLGVPSVLMDKDTERRKLYGKAGAFRPKSYGAEYRTLSNFWIWDDKLIDWAFDQTQRAVESTIDEVMLDALSYNITSSINNSDKRLAKQLAKQHNLMVL